MLDGETLREEADALLPELVELRRAIHAEPEIGLDNPKTTAKIRAALAGLPLELREGPSTSGLVAILRGSDNGRTVLLRGDMDALPMSEETGLAYSSQISGASISPRSSTVRPLSDPRRIATNPLVDGPSRSSSGRPASAARIFAVVLGLSSPISGSA